MEINLLFFICVVPAIIIFGIAKSGLGGSIALISIPLMTVVMPLGQALAYFKSGADSWGKTWDQNGWMTLLGKGTFY